LGQDGTYPIIVTLWRIWIQCHVWSKIVKAIQLVGLILIFFMTSSISVVTGSTSVDSYAGLTYPGKVSLIWPQLDEASRTAKVRLEIPNPDLKLSLGMFVNVRLDLPMGRQLVIPAAGVFQTGTRQVATFRSAPT
jgi:multidrug efflux pump subunit AcrA (membrane-fusion protein)